MKRILVLAALLALAGPAAALDRSAAIERAYGDMVAAQKALQDAQQRKERGVEPLPGERLGTAMGSSRLGPRYFDRQLALEREVTLAQRRYDEALARWNSVR